ncbi:hypothetical protein BGZ94_004991 [Podila epigama]|nr:hypothetical protein BGZ94_004991 [Podila epigama]
MDLALSLFQSPATSYSTTTTSTSTHLRPSPASTRASSPNNIVPARQLRPTPSTTSNHFLSLLFFQDSNSLPTASLVPHDQYKNFLFLRKSFEAILATMVRDRHRRQLVILCPVQQSLMGFNAVSKLEWEWGGIDEDFISSHVVYVPERNQPVAKNLSVTTLNGRSLILTDTTVTTAKGFKQLKQARLVAETIFYDNDGRGWVVHFIDRPLIGISQGGSPSNSTPGSPKSAPSQPQSQQSQVQSRSESSGQGHRVEASHPSHSPSPTMLGPPTIPLKRNRYRLGQYYAGQYRDRRSKESQPRPTLTLQAALQRFPGVSPQLEQLIMTFNDSTMFKSDLKEIRTSVDRLLADSVALLNKVDARVLASLLDEYNTSVETLDHLLENYIMNSTYDIVFFKITLYLKQQDWDLAEAIRELRNLDLIQVGLPDTAQYHQALVSALNEFQSIGVLRTPEEKLNCLIRSIRVSSHLAGGADDLVPTLLLTVLRSGISNLASNLYYMKNFVLFEDTTRGEYGYSLSTLEAVSRYIHSHVKQLAPISAKNQAFWELVCAGDVSGIEHFIADCGQDVAKDGSAAPPPSASPGISRRPSFASYKSGSERSIESTIHADLLVSPMYSRDAEGNNGVLLACKSQQLQVLQYLLGRQDYSVNVANYEGQTPLTLAASLDNLEMAKIILEHSKGQGQDDIIHRQDVFGNAPIHFCTIADRTDLLELILIAEPNLGQPNNEGDTALILAAKQMDRTAVHGSMVSLLIQRMKNQDLDRQNNSGDTALHFVYEPALIKELVERGANPSIENYAGWTPLLKWALHDMTAAVRTLLATNKVDALNTDSRGYTPLHMACLRGNLEMVTLLKEHTLIDLQSHIDGSTPLQLACQSGSLSTVEYLLREGANPEMRDWANESPADMTNDAAILDLLDNTMLFWDSRTSSQSSSDGHDKVKVSEGDRRPMLKQSGSTSAKLIPNTRVIRVVRGTMEQDGNVRYIVKSGSTLDKRTIVTMPRSLEDFKFLRETLLLEIPDACIPSLEHFFSPFLLSPSKPSKAVMAMSTRRLDMFLNYLSNHPVLGNHELVWEFMLMPELQREMITERSLCKQESIVDSIFDNFSPVVDDLEHQEMYFEHLNSEILKLEGAVQLVRKCSRRLSRSAQDVPQQLDILGTILDQADLASFEGKGSFVMAMKAIAATQTTMHTSDIESLGNLFEDFSFVIDGTLKALRHPQEIIANIRQMRAAQERAEQAARRNDLWWSGLSTIGEGAMTALGGAGAALGAVGGVVGQVGGAVGHAASSTFSAATGGHSKTQSEGGIPKSPGFFETRRTLLPPLSPSPLPPASAHIRPHPQLADAGSVPVQDRRSSMLVLSSTSSPSTTGAATLTPVQPRTQAFQPPSKTLSATSLLTSPFTTIASAASAATGQLSVEEIKEKIGRASSLLNNLHGSLFEELAHLQNHHTEELERAMKDFGARQLQIEKSRLRDMMEILSDLQMESAAASATGTSAVAATGSGEADGRPRTEPGKRLLSRQSSYNVLASSWIEANDHKPLDLLNIGLGQGEDEKEEVRMHQRAYAEQQERQRHQQAQKQKQRLQTEGDWSGDEDRLSEKVPFDD